MQRIAHRLSTKGSLLSSALRRVNTHAGSQNGWVPATTTTIAKPTLPALALLGLAAVASVSNRDDSMTDSLVTTDCEAERFNGGEEGESSHAFKLFVALEAKDEMEKVRLAQIIHDLHLLAKEESLTEEQQHGKGRLRRYVTMATGSTASARPAQPHREATEHHPDIGDRISLRDVDLSKLSHEDAMHLIEGLTAGSIFDFQSLQKILEASTKLLKTEPNLIDLSNRTKPVTVVGDLHGSLDSLTHILYKVDTNKQVVVFNGDFVDRGDHSLEVLLTLLILKLAYPNDIYLIRGNHEDSMVASVYGFRDEIRRKYGNSATKEIWDSISCSFAALPLALRTKTALVLHGGIPTPEFNLRNLVELPKEARFKMESIVNPGTPNEEFLAGILWSDPHPDDANVVEKNPRGVGIVFGSRVAQDFLERNNLKYIIRGHEVVQNGVRDMKCGQGSIVTVFSAAAYPAETGSNSGAFLHLYDDGSLAKESYSVRDISVSHKKAIQESTEYALPKVRSMIGCNLSKLEKAFTKVEINGMVTVEEWSKVMAETVPSPGMPWRNLQPILAPASWWYGTIDVNKFLKNHSLKIHGTDVDHHDAETLAENQQMLLTVFKFLDTDNDGTLSPKEFRTGVALLNKRLPTERQLKDPDELFKILDADGNGEISFEEFTNGFGTT